MFISCDKIKNKGHELVDKTEKKAKDKSKDLINKVIPFFDEYKADTKFNKQRFSEFLQVEQTSDVKNIFCYGDAIGIDAKYQFSFSCNRATVSRIIEKHAMTLDTASSDSGLGITTEFAWWDATKIGKLPMYGWKGEHEYYQCLWYDATKQVAYYLDYDM